PTSLRHAFARPPRAFSPAAIESEPLVGDADPRREKMLAEVEQMRAEAKSENERVIIDQQLKDMLPPAADTLPPETEVERSNRETVMANLPELQSAMGVGEEAARSPRLQVLEEDENGEVETEEVLLPAPSEENP
ncbi:MAG: hypothetical protein AAFX94_13580, partial [Myxococcota bacterium]